MDLRGLFVLLVCWALFPSCGDASRSAPPKIQALDPGQTLPGLNTEHLAQRWVHSPEEQPQESEEQLYRPKNFKEFPPSRFRMEYLFSKNGTCEWYYLSPDDNHQFKLGKWSIDSRDKSVLLIVKGTATEAYRVTELRKDLLRLCPLTQKD